MLRAAVAFPTIAALEGIFRAALYRYRKGESSDGFDQQVLASAFQAK